ncbi:MAG TPA: hypothetical protein VIY48_02665, partial [Candidatus Paceibacterota bacterium]
MRTLTNAVAGAALALSISVGFAQAASLSTDQVSAILNLIRSFGADQSVIDNVQASLTGGTPTVSNNQQGDNNSEDNNNNDSHGNRGDHGMPPPWMGSTTPSQGNGNGQGPTSCLTFTHNIGEGDKGDDVSSLQQML